MRQVINDCLKFFSDDFNKTADCLVNTYNKIGTHPEATSIQDFYILVDEIKEKYNNNQLSLVSARAEMIRAHSNTVEAADRANLEATQNAQQNYQDRVNGATSAFHRNQNYWNCLKTPGQTCIP